MVKNEDKINNGSVHFSYKDYKHKVKNGPNKDLIIFLSVFVIGLLIILGFVKILSPNVDVGIASNDEFSQFEDNISQSSVDDRLRHLRNEDAGNGADDTMFSPELDEKVILPKQKRKTVGEIEAEKQIAKIMELKEETPHIENKVKEVQNTTKEVPQKPSAPTQSQLPANNSQSPVAQAPAPQVVNAKVVVGYYATDTQAQVAKTILQDAGVGVTPIVKNMGEYYTLQVGSYSSKEKAQQAASNLLKSNFPARVIIE